MWIKIGIILFGILIIVLSITSNIKKNNKLTKYGYIFLICVLVCFILQIINESENSKNENRLLSEKAEMKNKVDSLKILSKSLTDSIQNLKYVLISIDNQFSKTNQKIFQLGKANDSLSNLFFIANRPIFYLSSSKVVKNNLFENQYVIEFNFLNEGKRSATNVFGKTYTIIGYDIPEIHDDGSLFCSLTDVYPQENGFTAHKPLGFNPDSTDYNKPIYYYFDIKYSDIILKTQYTYEVAVRLGPIEKGKYMNDLNLCRDWEFTHFKSMISEINKKKL